MVKFWRITIESALMATAMLTGICRAAGLNDTMTGRFDEHFRTLQVEVEGAQMGFPPVIDLDGDDRLIVSFDELADDRSYLRYSIVHCNADWQPSGLVDSEVLDGFNEGTIDDWEYSRMAYTRYVHYRIVLPNDRFRFKVSGNYLLRVYREDDPDETVLQARFMVCESTAAVAGEILFATDVDYRDRHQQLKIDVDVTNSQVEDKFNDLRVYVSQNGRLDNEVALRQPLRAVGDHVVYEHQPQLIFKSGNVYRRFEIVSTTVPSAGVEGVEFIEPYYHAFLSTDEGRGDGRFYYDLDLHGNYVVRERDSDDGDVDGDYVVTHFSLDIPKLQGRSVFIDGDMVNRRFSPESLMVYNESTGRYERNLLLKQGAYSYQYLTVGPGEKSGETATIEGDHYETRNRYVVKVYHRRRGERYDRLIGITILTF